MEYVNDFFEVGLLKWYEAAYSGISPDGIAWVQVPGEAHECLEDQLTCFEIKTRVADGTIEKAEKAC